MAQHNFEVGDIVKLRSGTSPQRVTRVSGSDIVAYYLFPNKHNRNNDWRISTDYELVTPPTSSTPKTKEPKMSALYRTNEETPRFGTLLATTTAGKLVIEMKPSGEPLIFDVADVTEVRPYTIRVSGDHHFVVPQGSVVLGDILIIGSSGKRICVEELDSKSNNAPNFKGRKVLTESLG